MNRLLCAGFAIVALALPVAGGAQTPVPSTHVPHIRRPYLPPLYHHGRHRRRIHGMQPVIVVPSAYFEGGFATPKPPKRKPTPKPAFSADVFGVYSTGR